MIEKYGRYRILKEFFNFPQKKFHIREISRMTEISQPSATNHLTALLKDKLILKEKTGIYPTYCSNRENGLFKIYKKIDLMLRMHETGFIDFVYDSAVPDSIILFGSASKGEDTEESDIDLFVQSPEKKLKLDKYEKLLKRQISIFFEENFSKLSKELKNNLVNGILIKGYLKAF